MPKHFCVNRAVDKDGPFCVVKALEGYGCCCPFDETDCHAVRLDPRLVNGRVVAGKLQVQCGGSKIGVPTLYGVCQDFEPSNWLECKLLVEPLEYVI